MFFLSWGNSTFASLDKAEFAVAIKSADLRMMYFSEHGFPMREFMRLRLGPVVMHDELDYFREVGLLEELRVTLELAELSADGSGFAIQNTFFRLDGKMTGRVKSRGGWMDLTARKLIAPPDGLQTALRSAPRSEDFVETPSSLK